MWDGDNWEKERFRAFTESLYDTFSQNGVPRELVNVVIDVDETESIEEFTFDNNSRWEYKLQFKVSPTKKVKELKDSPDLDGLMEEFERVNALMSSRATGSYIVTEDGFTMTGDRRNRQFAGLMSGVWKRNGSKLTLIGDSDSRLGTIILSK